jgi:hypothetical protein
MQTTKLYKTIFFVSLMFFLPFHCKQADQSNTNQKNYTINTDEGIFSASIHNNIAAFCTGEKTSNLSNRIYYSKLGSGKNKLLVKVDGKQKQAMPVRVFNERFVWVEYIASEGMQVQWELYTKLISDDSSSLILDNKSRPEIDFPNFDIFEDKIVFDYFTLKGDSTSKTPFYLYSSEDKELKEIFHPENFCVLDPSFNSANKNEVICNLVGFVGEKPKARIALYKIQEEEWNVLDTAISGFQPTLCNDKLVYKECDSPYSYGKIQLYNLSTKKVKCVSTHPLGGDFPRISKQYVVWECPSFNVIPAYDLLSNQNIVLDSGIVGKPFLNRNSLIWVKEKSKEKEVVLQSLIL